MKQIAYHRRWADSHYQCSNFHHHSIRDNDRLADIDFHQCLDIDHLVDTAYRHPNLFDEKYKDKMKSSICVKLFSHIRTSHCQFIYSLFGLKVNVLTIIWSIATASSHWMSVRISIVRITISVRISIAFIASIVLYVQIDLCI